MASRFKYLRAVRNKNYIQQGVIYFTLQDYARQSAKTKEKILALCDKAGGEYAAGLLEYLTTDADWRYICDKHFISSATLDRIRVKFYELW